MKNLPRDVQAALNRQVPRVLRNDFKKTFKKDFESLKKEMIKEFLAHPVTLEISAGPGAKNISGTLNGTSNLFAFIGFTPGEDPIKPIIEILERIDFKEGSGSKTGVDFLIDMPQSSDVFAVTPMPWATGRSWAKGIETGIYGLGYLLNKAGKSSRSGVAIQVKNKVRSGGFSNTPYISALLKKYENKFKKLK